MRAAGKLQEGRLCYTALTKTLSSTETERAGADRSADGAEEETAPKQSGTESARMVEGKRDLPCRLERDTAGDRTVVYYLETDTAGGVTENTLELLAGGRARLTRSGALSAVFSFIAGETTQAEMRTPYGSIALTLATQEIEIKEDRQEIGLAVSYRFLEAPEETHEVRYRIEIDPA